MPLAARSRAAQPWPAGAAKAASDDTGCNPGSVLDFDTDGAALHRGAALSILGALEAALARVPSERAGVRLHGIPDLAGIVSAGALHAVAATRLGDAARPVRAILFDKTAATNWALGWHQDRTIVVRERVDLPGYGPWSVKAGLQHVEPPFAIIEGMMTLRVHLDDVPADNAPLLVARGSHRLGRIPEADIADTVARCGVATCLAMRGDVWAYATAILHASAAAAKVRARRRVLQVDYSAGELPAPLAWLGV